jgi:predicted AlkP superfamily phosphohydrolase/phosphomutase
VLRRKGNRIRSRIMGPENSLLEGAPSMTIPFTIEVADDQQSVTLTLDDHDEEYVLRPGEYSDWVELTFKAGLGQKVRGIARFCVTQIEPELEMYMTPIHIDPENPAMPISHPTVYSIYLAKKLGKFATLGLAEDTWALNERVVDEEIFYKQAMFICDERIAMFKDALKRTKKGLVTCVFDTTDRVQHMFYRYLDPTHPANEGKDTERWKDAIAETYQRMDGMLGELMEELDREDTAFIVMSDHGFTNFRRGVNLNAWLRENGYLFLKEGHETSGDWFEAVDWSRTKAFSLGLTGMFINRKGREASGIVEEGEEYEQLKTELIAGLKELTDPQSGRKAVLDVFAATDFFDGPYRFDAPDLIIGYDGGFRNSWDCATGAVPREVFSDNTKSWSGDHCVDPRIVPGVFFSNRPILTETPAITDLAPSALKLFGVEPPGYMQGQPLFPGPDEDGPVKGPLDPATLNQSGVAPGARVHDPSGAPAASPAPQAVGTEDAR